ncbi:MAG: cytochrome P450, partial [Solirubrobacteraceae bacterium]
MSPGTQDAFPIGAAVTLEQLENDPHPLLARLRSSEPVSWLPALQGWLVTRHDLAMAVMRDASTFTVDDPRFSTAQVVGASMLSLDGADHARHRAPFAAPFRPTAVKERFARPAAAEADRLIDGFADAGQAELRREFAGPLAASIMARALGLDQDEVTPMLGWYDGIVAAVTEITAGHPLPAGGRDAFTALNARLNAVLPDDTQLLGAAATQSDLTHDQVISNAAILLFGGIETTEGMIANAVLHLLERPERLEAVRGVAARGHGVR